MKKHLTPNHIRYALANLPLLTFEVTDACNLKCKYCGYGEFYNDFRQKVNFNAVLHNWNTVQETHDFFKREYDKIPSIGELNNMGIREDKRELFNMTYRNQMESLMQSEHYEEIDKERFISSPTYQSVCTGCTAGRSVFSEMPPR